MKEVNSGIKTGETLILIAAIIWCLTIIGMIWGIPMAVGCSKRMKGEKEPTVGHIVVSVIFYSVLGIIGGILVAINMSDSPISLSDAKSENDKNTSQKAKIEKAFKDGIISAEEYEEKMEELDEKDSEKK